MPTGEDQRNPQALLKAAGEAHRHTAQVHAQVDRLLAELGESSELASALDQAVMNEDREAVVELLKGRGFEGEIRIEKLAADRMILLSFCVGSFGGPTSCVQVFIEW